MATGLGFIRINFGTGDLMKTKTQILFLIAVLMVGHAQFANADVVLPTAASLEGAYQGYDSQGKVCRVSFKRHLNTFFRAVYDVSIASEQEKLQFANVLLAD